MLKESRRRFAWPAASLLWVLLTSLAAAPSLASPLPQTPQIPQASQASGDLPLLSAAGAGQLVQAPDLASPAELVRFDAQLVPVLLALPQDARVRLAGWPIGPGERRDVLLARHEVYAPGARIFRVEAGAVTEVPRSRLVFFWGTHADDPLSELSVAVDPRTHTVQSISRSAAGTFELRPLTPGKPGLHLVAQADAFLGAAAGSRQPEWTCGAAELPPSPPPREPNLLPGIGGGQGSAGAAGGAGSSALGAAELAVAGGGFLASSALRTGTVAIDTDAQLLSAKFANDTNAATSYLASLFAAINPMYNRDLQMQLVQGTTFLRVGSDPYTVKDSGSASGSKLSELSNYWAAHYGSTARTVTAMISGLQGSSNSASGIAWVGGLCSPNYGYSFSQVFKINYLSGDALIVGHEIGHNFGSVHTHCYTPPIDQCFNVEPGCYSGATSCPAPATINGVPNVTGTIMSYCHLSGGCSSSMVFHPRTVAVIQPEINGALGVCIIGGGAIAPALSAVNPQSGPTAGGNTVTLSGSGFSGVTSVTFGGQAGSALAVVDDHTLTVKPPAHATGAVAVAVAGPGGNSALAPGYFYAPAAAAVNFYSVQPCRLIDTRNANGSQGGPALAAGGIRMLQATGACGVPLAANSVVVNVTTVSPTAAGSITIYPGNAFPLNTSNINFSPGQVRANNAVLTLATDGSGTFGVMNESGGATHFIIDVSGYFQ